MKATTSVPTRDASVLLYPLSNVLKVTKENKMSLALITVGTRVGCFHCSANCCATANIASSVQSD